MKALRSTVTALIAITMAATLSAQNPPPPQPLPEQPAPPAARGARAPAIPLEVQIVLSRYQGEKRISSMPYVIAVNANGERASLNMGADVAIPSSSFTPIDAAKSQPLVSYSYKNVGTSIVCGATTTPEDGRFEVNISVDDSSVYLKDDSGAATGSNMPAFRSFKSRNTLLLRDGQTRQYTAATDRVSGETIRIDVTLKVVK